VRLLSNIVASPLTRPVTRRMPAARTAAARSERWPAAPPNARRAKMSVESDGSPTTTSHRLPVSLSPDSTPVR